MNLTELSANGTSGYLTDFSYPVFSPARSKNLLQRIPRLSGQIWVVGIAIEGQNEFTFLAGARWQTFGTARIHPFKSGSFPVNYNICRLWTPYWKINTTYSSCFIFSLEPILERNLKSYWDLNIFTTNQNKSLCQCGITWPLEIYHRSFIFYTLEICSGLIYRLLISKIMFNLLFSLHANLVSWRSTFMK